MNINTNSNINFQAIKIAQTKNSLNSMTSKIDLYRLTPNDYDMLDRLDASLDFNRILGNKMPEFDKQRWRKIFEYAVDSVKDSNTWSFLAVSNSKICGLMSIIDNIISLELDAITLIPSNDKNKPKNVGNTMFLELFKIADKFKAKKIDLKAVVDGPFDVVSIYKKRGFKDLGMDGEYRKMSCNKYKIKEQLNELSSKIDYKPITSFDDENLDYLV